METRTPYHKHPLILNEDYIAREGDVCLGCHEKIISCKSFVYSCIRNSSTSSTSSANTSVDYECAIFLLHKSCAELPSSYFDPTDQIMPLFLCFEPTQPLSIRSNFNSSWEPHCNICSLPWRWFSYCNFMNIFFVCIKCIIFKIHSVEDRNFNHPSHPQHTLTIVQRPSSFKCDACKVDDNSRDFVLHMYQMSILDAQKLCSSSYLLSISVSL